MVVKRARLVVADDAASGAAPPENVVYFYPDGTTSSARVTLANDRSMFVDVRLRGLTGIAVVGDVLTAGASP